MAKNTETVGVGLLDELTLIASRAAAAILAVQPPQLDTRQKPDMSPVTAADEASEAVILEGLSRLMPGIPIISEEAAARTRPAGRGTRFLLVDPLDGTREFLAGRDEFAVNIALVDGAVPIAGVVAAPARGLVWRGAKGFGAERLALAAGARPESARERIAIHTRRRPADGPCVVVSRSHLDPATTAFIDRLGTATRVVCGSALKFCLLAEGTADLYPRLSQTSEWDVAAGHALLLAAGGDVTKPDGSALRYTQRDLIVPAFVAVGDVQAMNLP